MSENYSSVKQTIRSAEKHHPLLLLDPSDILKKINLITYHPVITPDYLYQNHPPDSYFLFLTPGDIIIQENIPTLFHFLQTSSPYTLRAAFSTRTDYPKSIHAIDSYYHPQIHTNAPIPNNYLISATALNNALSTSPKSSDFIKTIWTYCFSKPCKKFNLPIIIKNGFQSGKVEITASIQNLSDATVSIIIPTKNKYDYVKKCLDSIYKNSTHSNFEIILVDNGSDEPKLLTYIEELSSQPEKRFRCVRYDHPFNFAALNNFAASFSSSRFLLFLNNDTEVRSPGWMEEMMQYAAQPNHGVIGAKLLFPNKLIQHAGVIMGGNEQCDHLYAGHSLYSNFKQEFDYPRYYPAVTAACCMIERKKFELIKGFDESFEVEYNDIDLCLTALRHGYHNVYLPSVIFTHYESISRGYFANTNNKLQRHVREKILFSTKWIHFLKQNNLETDMVHHLLQRFTK